MKKNRTSKTILIKLVVAVTSFVSVYSFADAETTYTAKCGICHDLDDEKTPDRATLNNMGSARIEHALKNGRMQPYTVGMQDAEINALVQLLARPEGTISDDGYCRDRPISTEVVLTHWGYDIYNTRNQPLSEITSENVDSMNLDWVFGVPGVGNIRSFPAITTDTLFLPATNRDIYAIDRDEGCIKWRYTADEPLRTSANITQYNGETVLAVASSGSTVYLLDAQTGKLRWEQSVSLFDPGSMTTGAPVFYGDALFVPISAFEIAMAQNPRYECCKTHGAVSRLDLATGEVLWTTRMIEPAKKTYKNSIGTQMWGPSGAPVWTTPAIDPARNQLYVGTGENTSTPATETSDAIIALNLDDGSVKWQFQALANDTFNMACGRRGAAGANCPEPTGPDFDFGGSPMLVTLNDGTELVVAGQKSGDIWALNPDNGELVWNIKIARGSALGGIHWGTTIVGDYVFATSNDFGGREGARPGVAAVDMQSGKLAWQYLADHECAEGDWNCARLERFSAPPSATNDLVFAGSLSGELLAFEARTGEIRWQVETATEYTSINGVETNGGSIDAAGVAIAGSQVFVLSGYSTFRQLGGNALISYRLR